jgi:hypothetical protein
MLITALLRLDRDDKVIIKEFEEYGALTKIFQRIVQLVNTF